MTAPDFDFAVGLSSEALDTGIKELHTKHRGLFQGTEGQDSGAAGPESASWDVTEPPTVKVGPPSADDWSRSTDPGGHTPPSAPMPTDSVLQITLTKTNAKVGDSEKNLIDQKDVDVYAALSVADGKINVTILAIRLDTSGMARWDKAALHVMLPKIMKAAGSALTGFSIPVFDFFGEKISLAPKVFLTTGTHVVLTAKKKNANRGAAQGVTVTDFTWPSENNIWVLLSPEIVEYAISVALDNNTGKGKTQNYNHTEGALNIDINYYLDSYKDLKFDTTDRSVSGEMVFQYEVHLTAFSLGGGCSGKKACDSL